MTYPFARMAQKWLGVPLMMDEAKVHVIAEAFGPRILGGDVHLGVLSEELREQTNWWGEKTYLGPKVVDGVALIEVEGVLVDKGAWTGQHSGMTSYEGVSVQIADARANDAIKAAVFEVDTPGGLVSGCFELADEIAALSAEKPTVAILTDAALSAGYLLASACGSVIIPRMGVAGSIGVVTTYVNALRRAEKEGFDITVMRAGDKKSDGDPLAEQRPEWFDETRARLNSWREKFAETVAGYRSALTMESVLGQEAGLFYGEEAVAAGLADAVADPKQAFREFVAMYGDESLSRP